MLRMLPYLVAVILSTGSAWIHPPTDERAIYGHEGPMEQNLQPRELAGWPAPYLADNPHTSVIHQLGLEDTFRAGPFVATFSFRLLVSLAARHLLGRLAGKKPRG
jgi:hypothetical protein